jgi:hypothetical protein
MEVKQTTINNCISKFAPWLQHRQRNDGSPLWWAADFHKEAILVESDDVCLLKNNLWFVMCTPDPHLQAEWEDCGLPVACCSGQAEACEFEGVWLISRPDK